MRKGWLLLRKVLQPAEKSGVKGTIRMMLVCIVVHGMSGGYLWISLPGTAHAADNDVSSLRDSAGEADGDTSQSNQNDSDARDKDSPDDADEGDNEDTADPDTDFNDGMDNPVAIAATSYGELDGSGQSGSAKRLLQKLEDLGMLSPVFSDESRTDTDENSTSAAEIVLLPAPLPHYSIGDAYIYSDGSWERVNDVSSETVTWSNYRGNYSSGNVDFTYKRTEWETIQSVGERSFSPTRFLFDESTDSLWPLASGNKTRFDEKERRLGPDGVEVNYTSYWRCDVKGAEKVKVVAGEFDTWCISCARYADSYSYPKSQAEEYRTWYYAPDIQYWVLQIQEEHGTGIERRKELVAVVPDLSILIAGAADSRQVQEQFQEVLESNDEGEIDLWMAASGRVTISMTAEDRYLAADNIPCRKYEQWIQAGDLQKSYLGIACRDADGMWSIPRL